MSMLQKISCPVAEDLVEKSPKADQEADQDSCHHPQ